MRILIYDTECNSLDTKNGFIQEIAWAVYNVCELLGWRMVKSKSYIMKWNLEYDVDPDAEEITGLRRKFCEENGTLAYQVFMDFQTDLMDVDYVGGHNAILYDKPMCCNNYEKLNSDTFSVSDFRTVRFLLREIPHLDSYFDIEYPKKIKNKQLDFLAFKHGFVTLGAHEALADVQADAHIFSCYGIERIIQIASTPLVRITAVVPYGDKRAKEAVYKNGFRWDADSKTYQLVTRAFHLERMDLGKEGVITSKISELDPNPEPETESKPETSPQTGMTV